MKLLLQVPMAGREARGQRHFRRNHEFRMMSAERGDFTVQNNSTFIIQHSKLSSYHLPLAGLLCVPGE